MKEVLLCGEEWNQYDTETVFTDLLRHRIRIRRCFGKDAVKRLSVSASEAENILALTASQDMTDAAVAAGMAVLGVELTERTLTGCRYIVQGAEGLTYEYCRRVFERAHHLPWEIGYTGRCLIRELCPDDLDDLYAMYESDGIGEYVEPLYERKKEEEYQRQYIENMYAFWGYGMWLVWDKDGKNLIGRAGLERKVINGENILEIGYIIAPEYRRQGYALEICNWILAFAAEKCPGEKLNAFIEKGNQASIALIQKLGFIREGQENLQGKVLERYVKTLLF